MKYRLAIFFSLMVVPYCYGQNYPDSGFTNKAEARNQMVNGKQEGKWVEYYDESGASTTDTSNAAYYYLTIYNAGKPYGIARVYWGRYLKYEIHYRNGIENGVRKAYYESGKIQEEYPYLQGRVNGIEEEFYESGQVKSQTPMRDNIIDGMEKNYYEYAGMQSKIPYIKGAINGVEQEYYVSGPLMRETPYTNNQKNGVEKTYWEDGSGKLKQEITYVNNKIVKTINYDGFGKEIK